MASSFDDFNGLFANTLGDCYPERLGCLQVDAHVEQRRSPYRDIARVDALDNFINYARSATVNVGNIGSI